LGGDPRSKRTRLTKRGVLPLRKRAVKDGENVLRLFGMLKCECRGEKRERTGKRAIMTRRKSGRRRENKGYRESTIHRTVVGRFRMRHGRIAALHRRSREARSEKNRPGKRVTYGGMRRKEVGTSDQTADRRRGRFKNHTDPTTKTRRSSHSQSASD